MTHPDQHAPMMFVIGPLTLKTKGNITITDKVYFLSKNNAIQPSGSYTTFWLYVVGWYYIYNAIKQYVCTFFFFYWVCVDKNNAFSPLKFMSLYSLHLSISTLFSPLPHFLISSLSLCLLSIFSSLLCFSLSDSSSLSLFSPPLSRCHYVCGCVYVCASLSFMSPLAIYQNLFNVLIEWCFLIVLDLLKVDICLWSLQIVARRSKWKNGLTSWVAIPSRAERQGLAWYGRFLWSSS